MNRASKFRRGQSLIIVLSFLIAILFIWVNNSLAQERAKSPSTKLSSKRSITIRTQPNAVVWIDEVRRGVTDNSGSLVIGNVAAGRRMLRVRANGFQEASVTLRPAQGGKVEVRLLRTKDQAVLLFQQAETARESARDDPARTSAADLYRSAIKLHSNFGAAHLGLARVLLELNDYTGALEEIEAAHASRRNYPEASAVEGRILRMAADEAGAIEAFQRAIAEAKGFQPEAHTGLALVCQDKGQFEEATTEFRKAIAQLSDTEPVLYQFLGSVYEKQEKYKEAVAAYEKYLELAPDGNLAPAIRSVMDQLRKQAEGRSGLPY